METNNYRADIRELKRWASRHENLRPPARWDSARRLMTGAKDMLEQDARRTDRLLLQSKRRLAPLEDPLQVEFGLHRWLSGQREEVYSDWLQWVLLQIGEPKFVFPLLGLSLTEGLQKGDGIIPVVERELLVPEGADGQTGRLDIVLRYRRLAVVVIEVKLTRAEAADTTKQKGYSSWLRRQPEPSKSSVLLVIDAAKEQYEGFRTRSWREFCLGLRRLVPDLRTEDRGLLTIAMILGFVGAIEQNLLDLPHRPVERSEAGQFLNLTEVNSYLQESL